MAGVMNMSIAHSLASRRKLAEFINSDTARIPGSPLALCSASPNGSGRVSFGARRRWSSRTSTRTSAEARGVDDLPSTSLALSQTPRKAAEIVQEFYDLVNQRDYVGVSGLFAEDCVYEDFTFSEPVKGREAALKFFEKVMTSMGPELKFVIDDSTRDDPAAVGVVWHLEWRGKRLPFSRGCSFYRCELSTSGQRQIKFARDIVEPAAKPGDVAMGAVRAVTSLLERFPQLADRFD